MARIVFQLDVDVSADDVVHALDSQAGIAGWWTDDVEFAGGTGSTMSLGFPIAPSRFELRVDDVSDRVVRWTSVGEFPPHWANTTIVWTLSANGEGRSTTIHFSHDGWPSDDGPLATAALTWGQLMLTLKQHCETRTNAPLFRRA
jgi:hypothetical protein